MSGLQPGLALNEKQAGRLRPAPRAVWAGPLGRAAMEDTLAVPGSPPTSMGGLGGWPAGLGQRLHGGREGRRGGAQHHPGGRWSLFCPLAPTHFCNVGTGSFTEPQCSHIENGSKCVRVIVSCATGLGSIGDIAWTFNAWKDVREWPRVLVL